MPTGRKGDLRVLAPGPRRERPVAAGSGRRPRSATCRRSCAARSAASAARGQRARGGAPLHAPVAAELLDRHALLSARLVHDEVQPQGLQPVRDAAGVPGAPSARARERTARDFSPACTSCRRCSRRSPACRAWRSSPMAGAHGEFAGVAMIRAYHRARGDLAAQRDHRAGGRARHQSRHRHHVRLRGARECRWTRDGDVDLEALQRRGRARTPPASC